LSLARCLTGKMAPDGTYGHCPVLCHEALLDARRRKYGAKHFS
jgi:hypothetical protein